MSHKFIFLKLESSLQNKSNHTKTTTNPAISFHKSHLEPDSPDNYRPGNIHTVKVTNYPQGCTRGWTCPRKSTKNWIN